MSGGCAILCSMIYVLEAPVVANKRLKGHNYLLSIRAPEIAEKVLPGQFVMAAEVTSQSLPYPLLKRALAVYSVLDEKGRGGIITTLLKVVGTGTRRLATLETGDSISLIGPLGNGFDLGLARGKISVIVAGGVGIASFYMLARHLQARGEEVRLVYGGRTARDLAVLEDFQSLGIPIFTATEDGSLGFAGMVTCGLENYLQSLPKGDLVFYTCGPNPMMKAVSRLAAAKGIPCQISVEAKMGCGFGVCLGCTVKTRDGFKLACKDGPIFDAADFVWEEGSHAS
jgi:dihydroorotate dehydrogenase electron transfer subunit